MLGYVESDRDLEIFYYFVLNPFSIPPTERTKRKFGKFSGMLKIEAKRTYVSNNKFIYVPERHNLSFIRAHKMLHVFLKRRNLKTISRVNPYFIDVFYKVANEQVFENERCRVDMAQVFTLMQYFLTLDPLASLKNIVRYHLVFELLGHVDVAPAKEILAGLLTPGDNLFKVQDRDRKILTDYLLLANFGQTLTNNFTQFRISSILAEKSRAMKDDKIKVLIKELEKKFPKVKGETKPKNVFLSFFHSFLGMKKVRNQDIQPEEIFTSVLDIDWLGNYPKPIQRSRLSKKNTVGNMSGLLEDLDADPKVENIKESKKAQPSEPLVQPSTSKVEASEKDIHENSVNPNLLEQNEIVDLIEIKIKRKRNKKAFKKLRGLARFVMCFNLFLNKPQQMFKLKKDKGALHFNAYPENIQSSNIDIKTVQSNPKAYFEKCIKQEARSSHVLDVITGCINGAIMQKNQGEFMKAIRLNVSEQDWVTPLFFNTETLFFEILKVYILKVQFHLENKPLFMSGYWAGKFFITMCKEL